MNPSYFDVLIHVVQCGTGKHEVPFCQIIADYYENKAYVYFYNVFYSCMWDRKRWTVLKRVNMCVSTQNCRVKMSLQKNKTAAPLIAHTSYSQENDMNVKN